MNNDDNSILALIITIILALAILFSSIFCFAFIKNPDSEQISLLSSIAEETYNQKKFNQEEKINLENDQILCIKATNEEIKVNLDNLHSLSYISLTKNLDDTYKITFIDKLIVSRLFCMLIIFPFFLLGTILASIIIAIILLYMVDFLSDVIPHKSR